MSNLIKCIYCGSQHSIYTGPVCMSCEQWLATLKRLTEDYFLIGGECSSCFWKYQLKQMLLKAPKDIIPEDCSTNNTSEYIKDIVLHEASQYESR